MTIAAVHRRQPTEQLRPPEQRLGGHAAEEQLRLKRYAPALSHWKSRAALGLALSATAAIASTTLAHVPQHPAVLLFLAAWVAACAVTDKYTHKYPYRYYPYLLASHAKAALVMAAVLGIATWVLRVDGAVAVALWQAFGWFSLADVLASVPRRSQPLEQDFDPAVLKSREVAAQADAVPAGDPDTRASGTPAHRTFASVSGCLDSALTAYVEQSVPSPVRNMSTLVVSSGALPAEPQAHVVELVVHSGRINDLRRINRFILQSSSRLVTGGYFVCRYEPLESRRAAIAARWGGLFWPAFVLHFAWHRVGPKIPLANKLYFAITRGRNRALSKAEVWGRLSFCGLKVVNESADGAARFVTAQKIAPPIVNKKPSYYPVVGLTKVGLDGQMLQTHKVRSMYPFSEFLQKQVFEAHGLVGTGKLKNDFRLTEYGKFFRRHWIDELPQLYDWLRGDIKLVGMRATSPHFLSLYPREFIQLYVIVKPGLIPPLFDEKTEGLDAIVAIEFKYLRQYARAPFRTDAILLRDTMRAIFFHGVRSK